MKKTNVMLCAGLIAIAAVSCNNTPAAVKADKDSFYIRGKIAGVESGIIKLMKYNDEDRSNTAVDSVPMVKGSFEFRGKKDVAELMSLKVEPGGWTLPVFVENSKITVDADTTGSEHFDYTAYGMGAFANIKKYTVSGSVSDKEYKSLQEEPEYKAFQEQFKDLNKKYDAEKDKTKKEAMRSLFDSVRNLQAAWQKSWIDKYITNNPSSVAGAYMLSDFFTFNSGTSIGAMDSMLNKFTAPANQSVYYKSLTNSANSRKALLPGNVAPDFSLLKRDSSSFTLSSTRGKYIMLDFWASWCHPCREAIPHWKKVYEKYKSKNFDIVSVSDDSRWSDWIKAMDQEKMPWIQVIDKFPVKNMPSYVGGKLYQTHYIPAYVLLDKEGKIILYNPSEEEMDAKLAEVLK